MNITHLYHTNTSSENIQEILGAFKSSISVDISNIDTIEQSHVYIVELGKIDKVISSKLTSVFKQRPNALIYFLISQEYNLMLFQTAFLLNVKTVITQKQNIKKVILKIKSDIEIHEDEYIKNSLGHSLLKTQHFMFFKNKKLFFVSKKLYEDFKCSSFAAIEKEICSKLVLDELLQEDSFMKTSISNKYQNDVSYSVRSNSINNNEKIIYLEPFLDNDTSDNEFSFISNRLSFIELVKDKLLEKSISKRTFSIMTIQIENINKLQSDLSEVELQALFKEFLLQVELILDKKIILAQYDKDFYVTLFEGIEFEDLKIKAQTFHNQILNFLKDHKFNPIIGLFIFEINTDNLNDVLTTLKHIISRTLSQNEVDNKLEYINKVQENMDSEEALMISLDSAFSNGVEFKLLNIYKGLCINTSSKIIKKKDNNIYVQFEHLQGIVMKNEKETILQSSSFTKDIRASVKYIDLDKKIAILSKFQFLNSNANARKYSRVTCSTRTPLVLSHQAGTVNGEILDISVSSIAIKAKYREMMEKIKQKDVTLNFVLPTDNTIDGYVRLSLNAKVVFIHCEEHKCKIVCDLYRDENNEAIIMEYVYNRQKEIIVEVKKMAKNF